MLFTLRELIDVIIMTLAVGYLFKDMFPRYTKQPFFFACLVTAPALILHELAHKFLAISFGIEATFHAAYFWLLLGIILKTLRFGFVFFVPAYVSIEGNATPMQSGLIAGAGPFLNLLLFLTAYILLRQKKLTTGTYIFLEVTKQLNLFLFIFNMLPLPFFDGLKFYSGIFGAFF